MISSLRVLDKQTLTGLLKRPQDEDMSQDVDKSQQVLRRALDTIDPSRHEDAEQYVLTELRARSHRGQYSTWVCVETLAEDVKLANSILKPGERFDELREAKRCHTNLYLFDGKFIDAVAKGPERVNNRFHLLGTYREPHESLDKSYNRLKEFREKVFYKDTPDPDVEALYALVGDNRHKFATDGSYGAAFKNAANLLNEHYFHHQRRSQALDFMRFSLQECRPQEPIEKAMERVSILCKVGGDVSSATSYRARLQQVLDSGNCVEGTTLDDLLDEMDNYLQTADTMGTANRDLGESAYRYTVNNYKKPSAVQAMAASDGWLVMGDVRIPVRSNTLPSLEH